MRRLLFVAGFALTASSAEAHRPARPCYDLVIVGTLERVTNVVDLNDIMPRDNEELYLGGRADVQIDVTDSEGRELEGETISVRAFFTDMPRLGARLRFLLRRPEAGADWYRGVYWDWATRLEVEGTIPRCQPPAAN